MVKHISKRTLIIVLSLVVLLGAVAAVVTVKLATPKDEVFTLLWTTDPQWYSFKYPEIIEHQTQWVADNREAYDIRYAIHTGDFVDNPHNHDQWAIMTEAYTAWDEAGLPYGILAGNHDVDGDDHTEFSQYFGKARYENNEWYGGDYDDNFGHYDLMTIEGVKFIFVYLGYNDSYTQEDYDWLNSVLSEHSDRIAILGFHDYMEVYGERSTSGEAFFQKVILKNPNVRMVLCGHNYFAARKIDKVDDNGDGTADRTVFQFMANYQSSTNGGNGFMRFMECDLANGTITSRTYSPYIDEYGSDYESPEAIDEYGTRDEFTIPFDFSAPAAKEDGAPETGTVIEPESNDTQV